MDTTTLVAALLHDTVEDTGLTIGEVKAEFGAEVAVLVDGVTKLDGSRWGDHAEAETFKKMIVAASIDLRVLVIKLADRVHNLRTLAAHPQREKRERIARASMELLVPFASSGSGSTTTSGRWRTCRSPTSRRRRTSGSGRWSGRPSPARDAVLAGVAAGAREELAAVGLRAKVEVRARHLYSIHRDLPARGQAGLDQTPPGSSWWWTGPRPTATSRSARCTAGGARSSSGSATTSACRSTTCTARCTPPCWSAGRDGEGGDLVGMLIRTPAMDRIASNGVAARIREAGGKDGKVTADMARQADLDWLDRLLAWQPLAEAADFLDGLRADLSHGGIVVFTPAGDPVKLPSGSTAVDFAYAVSPADGRRLGRGARQRRAQGDGEPPRARPGRRPDRRPLRRPARLLARRRPAAARPAPT